MVGGDGGDRVATDRSGAVLVGVAGALNRAADVEGVAVPLVARGRALGVLAFAFPEARDFTEDDTVLLGAVSEQCALALDRASLFESQRSARQTSEFLGDATQLMVSALDPRDVL